MQQQINVHKLRHQQHNSEGQNAEETACQPTLHDTWRPNLCTKNQENPRDGIFIHGTRIQGPRVDLIIHR